MKIITKMLVVGSGVAMTFNASAGHHSDKGLYASGKVIAVTPVYQNVRVEHIHDSRCWSNDYHQSSNYYHNSDYYHKSDYRDSNAYQPHTNKVATTVVGAVVGGALGHVLFKKTKFKGLGTVAGALVGGTVANDISQKKHRYERGHSNQGHSHTRSGYAYSGNAGSGHQHSIHRELICQREYSTIEEISGYNVTYRYQGEVFHTHTRYHPGKRIKLRVNVKPV